MIHYAYLTKLNVNLKNLKKEVLSFNENDWKWWYPTSNRTGHPRPLKEIRFKNNKGLPNEMKLVLNQLPKDLKFRTLEIYRYEPNSKLHFHTDIVTKSSILFSLDTEDTIDFLNPQGELHTKYTFPVLANLQTLHRGCNYKDSHRHIIRFPLQTDFFTVKEKISYLL
jgi:hypothetical protein